MTNTGANVTTYSTLDRSPAGLDADLDRLAASLDYLRIFCGELEEDQSGEHLSEFEDQNRRSAGSTADSNDRFVRAKIGQELRVNYKPEPLLPHLLLTLLVQLNHLLERGREGRPGQK